MMTSKSLAALAGALSRQHLVPQICSVSSVLSIFQVHWQHSLHPRSTVSAAATVLKTNFSAPSPSPSPFPFPRAASPASRLVSPLPSLDRCEGTMAAGEGIAEAPQADGVKSQLQPKQSTTGVRVEQPHRPLVGDVQAELTTAIFEAKGVRELLRNYTVKEIPEYYIKPESTRQQPANIVEPETAQSFLPVIDLAASSEELVKAMRKAGEWGYFQVINHGICPNLLRKMSAEAEDFFALPVEEKIRCCTPKKVAGPIFFGGGSKGDWRDVLKINCAPPSAVAKELWPSRPVGFRETLTEHIKEQQVLANRLMGIISESLRLERNYIQKACEDPRILMAINHYPPCPDPSLTMGIREHSDPNTITILLETGVGGLQFFRDGLWFDVKPRDNALVVNAGDHLQILSNGRYPSCLHRVVNSKLGFRTSVALFFSPSMTANIKPAPALVDDEHPAQYREFVYSEFLKNFYANGGPNKKVVLGQFQTKKNESKA